MQPEYLYAGYEVPEEPCHKLIPEPSTAVKTSSSRTDALGQWPSMERLEYLFFPGPNEQDPTPAEEDPNSSEDDTSSDEEDRSSNEEDSSCVKKRNPTPAKEVPTPGNKDASYRKVATSSGKAGLSYGEVDPSFSNGINARWLEKLGNDVVADWAMCANPVRYTIPQPDWTLIKALSQSAAVDYHLTWSSSDL